jgi:hypothetical protein
MAKKSRLKQVGSSLVEMDDEYPHYLKNELAVYFSVEDKK